MTKCDSRPPSPALAALEADLAAGQVVMIDGATGTELERRGADMDDGAWCAIATLTAPDMLRSVHEDYIEAGVRLITANTFSSNRIMLGPAGYGDKVELINRRAVEIALEARDSRGAGDRVVVAGSMSHQVPYGPEEGGRRRRFVPEPAASADGFREIAGILAAAGVDLILLEMMADPELANPAIDAALETGLPVWIGYSVQAGPSGELVSCTVPELGAGAMFDAVPPARARVAGVMHSNAHVTTRALDELRQRWSGPTMVYPDSGYFEMPHWQFVDIMPPEEFARRNLEWIASGAQVVGGCCGLGLEHIQALAGALERR